MDTSIVTEFATDIFYQSWVILPDKHLSKLLENNITGKYLLRCDGYYITKITLAKTPISSTIFNPNKQKPEIIIHRYEEKVYIDSANLLRAEATPMNLKLVRMLKTLLSSYGECKIFYEI